MTNNFHHLDLSSLSFDIFTKENIKNLSVAKIFTKALLDQAGHPIPGGLYDPALGKTMRTDSINLNNFLENAYLSVGPFDYDAHAFDSCQTCGNRYDICTGHMGHIELCYPVFNPIFRPTIYDILRISCVNNCFKLQFSSKFNFFHF